MHQRPRAGSTQAPGGRAAGRRRGQAAGLTLDQITAAALTLIADQGLPRLTIRSLATRLGVTPSALYNHVADRTGLIDAVLERVLGGIELHTDPGLPWPEQLTVLAHRLRKVLQDHPGTAGVLKGHDPTGENSMRMGDAFAQGIQRSGLTGPDAGHAWYTLIHYVIGFESTFAADTHNLDRARNPVTLTALHARFQTLDPVQYPALHELGTHIWNPDLDARFAYGLNITLAGIAAQQSAS